MTPAARIAAAIEVLDSIFDGAPAEKTLTTWARKSRYAGSGDRAAIRDLVFDALRCRRSYGWLGGGDTGRALMIGALRVQCVDPAAMFTGKAYAPPTLTLDETAPSDLALAPDAVRLDMPDWLMDPLLASLGDNCHDILRLMQSRAPIFLRVNMAVCTRENAAAQLLEDGIATVPHPLSDSALEVRSNPRKVQTSTAYLNGMVELQDAASQAVVDALELKPGDRVLDYCAGGGGKALAIASRFGAQVFAHDANPARMRDIPLRAARAGVEIPVIESPQSVSPFDLVLCDAPCSGSGAWRRSPEAKWRLTPERLDEFCQTQADILDHAASLVRDGGFLAYVTCSLLDAENRGQVNAFLTRTTGFAFVNDRRLTPLAGGDGFYVAKLVRLTARP